MQRNLDRRIETMFPVEDPDVKKRVLDILDTVWRDTIKTRILQSDGSYARIDKRGKELLSSQDVFKEEAAAAYEKIKNKNPGDQRTAL